METFLEKQRFNQSWLWIPFATTILIVGIITVTTQSADKHWAERYLGLLILIPVALLLGLTTLETKINEEAIFIRFIPFINSWKAFKWEEIEKAYVRKYKPLTEYGGWGVKGFSRKNLAYNVSGDIGLQLELKNGKKVLIGSNKKQRLEEYLQYLKKKYAINAIVVD
ncbi:MAG: hypothetical protein ACK4K9_07010 [Bacteroidia bacterium]